MKNSIRFKLFAGISSIILFVFVALFLANTFLSKPFFLYEQSTKFKDAYTLIDGTDETDYLEVISNNDELELTANIEIILSDEDDNIIYSSQNPERAIYDRTMCLSHIDDMQNYTTSDAYSIYIDDDENNPDDQKYLLLYGSLTNGNEVIFRSSLTSIEYNIDITNQFIIYIGIASLLLGMILTLILSRKFTKPILKINETTKKIKELDFSEKVEYKSNDEIGELAESINEMALSLSEKITNLKNLNSVLMNETEKNKVLLEKRRQLLNDVSHDLKTPLSLIQGYAEALKLNVNSSKEKADFYCDVISEETAKMNMLVEELLNVNRSYPSEVNSQTDTFEINRFLRKEMEKYEKIIEDKKINFAIEKNEPIKVTAYKSLVDRVITNFIVNAIRYVDKNLKIRISTENLKDTVKISFYNSCDSVTIDELPKLWDAFYKVDDSRNRTNEGHGLGLSIVKNIQETLGLGYGVKLVDGGIIFWFEINKK